MAVIREQDCSRVAPPVSSQTGKCYLPSQHTQLMLLGTGGSYDTHHNASTAALRHAGSVPLSTPFSNSQGPGGNHLSHSRH